MAWIKTVDETNAEGELARTYDELRQRAGAVANILQIHSLAPDVLKAHLDAKMYRRKRRQHLYESIDQSAQELSEERPFYPKQFADWRDLPSDAVEQKEVREAVAKALAELPDIYREVFVLRDMQHLDVCETAKVLGVGESAVKTRLHRARLMMR